MALFRTRGTVHVGYPLKRFIDVFFASGALVVLVPVFALIALAIKLNSNGPVFFRQRRLGLNEYPFEILKFRSMRPDASSCGPAYTQECDPRITWIGGILRKTSLDELPQLINVVRGEMSLFGPRPFVGFELENWTDNQRAIRSAVRPGISGLAQTRGRSELTEEAQREYDLCYVAGCNLSMDLWLAVCTAKSVLTGGGTN